MRCKKCGMELADSATFCIGCGTTVKKEELAEEKTEPPAEIVPNEDLSVSKTESDQDVADEHPSPNINAAEPVLPHGKKEKLFVAGLVAMIFLYVKDNELDKDLNFLKKAWNNGTLKKEILSRMEVHPDFADVLDKSDLFQSCYEIFLSCYDQRQASQASVMGKIKGVIKGSPKIKVSEAAVIGKLKEMMEGASQSDQRYVVDMILIMAFADQVITDKEKEGMGQIMRHLGISDSLFKEMFSAKKAEIDAEVKRIKRRRFWTFCTASALICSLIIAGIFFAMPKSMLNGYKNMLTAYFGGEKEIPAVSTPQETPTIEEKGSPAEQPASTPQERTVVEEKGTADSQLAASTPQETPVATENGTSKETADSQLVFTVSSFKVSRENKKNVFPLRRLFPFYAELILESPDLNEGQRRKFCSLITSPSPGFTVQKSSVIQYENGKLSIEIEAQDKNLGEQTFAVALNDDPDFVFKGEAETPMMFQERIAGCSAFFEKRDDPSKEFESGKGFAECVNNWMITPEIQSSSDLSKNEREIPQRDFDTFIRDFMKAEDKPKNPFNWFVGVLNVKPREGYVPYLTIFQVACIQYLANITGGYDNNAFIAFLQGLNDFSEYEQLCDPAQNTMITCTGVNEIAGEDYLKKKQMFRQVESVEISEVYEGDKEKGYSLKETSNSPEKEKEYLPWIYNSEELSKQLNLAATAYSYKIRDNSGLVFTKELCVLSLRHFPDHSLGYDINLSKGDTCEKWTGFEFNFKMLFQKREGKYKEDPWLRMANFIYSDLIMGKYEGKHDPYTELDGSVYLMALRGERLFLEILGETRMEKGKIFILLKEDQLKTMFQGGYLVYAYDVTNMRFGVVLDLSQPVYEGLYIKATGNFFPLD
jgi:hypothetical protein